MIILDIDQDFFFTYEGESKTQTGEPEDFIEQITIQDVLKKYDSENAPFKIFSQHDEVYYEIHRMKIKDIHLIHLDRHDDLERDEYNSKCINLGNWISYLINDEIVKIVDWVSFQDLNISQDKKFNEKKYTLNSQNYFNHQPLNIDYIFFTLSPEFVPHHNNFLKFIEIKSKVKQLNGQIFI
ncbi:MAG: hypothetical protein ACOC3V_05820 [bacterium]